MINFDDFIKEEKKYKDHNLDFHNLQRLPTALA